MSVFRARLKFTGEIVKEPIIYRLVKEFEVVPNLRKALFEDDTGWVDIEISGDFDEIERAVKALKEWGIEVYPIEGDVIE